MSTIRLYPSGKEVSYRSGDTVLTALENAGYALPNNCRAGACGECKVKVREGEFDQGMVLDMALSQEEREQGYGLMCMAKPLSETLEIEWGTDDAKPKLFPPRENVRCMVTERIQRTPRIIELHIRPLGEPLRYWPGQYVVLEDPQSSVKPRSYSIANAPRANGDIVLQITRIPEGETSNWVHDEVKVGSMLNISGPYGTFIGDPSIEAPVLCLASGTGLAPILSLADAALRRKFSQRVTLMFSGREEEDVYCRGLIDFWNAKYRKFKFIPTLTREEKSGYESGRITQLLPEKFPDLSGYAVYVAGSPEFVADCIKVAKELGAQEDRIFSEGFFAQQQAEAPDADRLMSL